MGSVSIKSVFSLAFTFGLAAFALTASAAPTAKAVWDSKANTFTFYYDENTYEGEGITQYAMPTTDKWDTYPDWNLKGETGGPKTSVTKVIFDESFAAYPPINMNYWFNGFSSLTTMEGVEYLKTSSAGYCTSMFGGCSSLTSIDLSHFDTTKMKFRTFFNGCNNIEVLDLTSFTKFSDLRGTFSGMSKLKTIYVTDVLDCDADSTTTDTFKGCNVLIGGGNPPTTFANAKITHGGYARIDNPPDAPGYFTLGQKQVPPEVESVMASDLTHSSITITVEGSALNDGTIAVELITGGETVKTEALTDFGSVAFTGLTPETEYAVKVTATSQYGTTINTDCVFTTPEEPANCWLYDAGEGSVSWSEWTFNATLAKDGTLQVGVVTHWPQVAMALDFSLPVKDESGTDYVISSLDPRFGFFDKDNKSAPAAYPQAAMVGKLTLPGEGLVKILDCAFMGCELATGHVEFPSTVTQIGRGAFDKCKMLEINCMTIPDGVLVINSYCFCEAARAYGDVVLTNVTLVSDSAFQGTAITSATFGPGLTGIGGNYDRGAFQKCVSLTNLSFDADSRWELKNGYTFKGCEKLNEIDFKGLTLLGLQSDKSSYSHFTDCKSLKKIVFDATLTNLVSSAYAGCTALESIVFEGVPPVAFEMPYLSPWTDPSKADGKHDSCYDNKSITTYVHRKLVNEKNEAGMCWADYAANGQIGAAKTDPAKNTTWAAEYVYEGVNLANRQLLTIEPGTGLMLIVR